MKGQDSSYKVNRQRELVLPVCRHPFVVPTKTTPMIFP